MRISIRWKLILSIGIPLLLVYGISMFYEFYTLKKNAFERVRSQAQIVADHYATQLSGDFKLAAQVAKSFSDSLSSNPSFTTEQLYALLGRNVQSQEIIYGSAVAFEPDAYPEKQGRFCPYVYGPNLHQIDIAKDSYNYLDKDWYHIPKTQNIGIWSEPYFDTDAGNILMCTYSAPFYKKDGAFWGIATIDIALDYIQDLLELDTSKETSFAILSEKGQYISHTRKNMIMKETIFEQADHLNSPKLKSIGNKMIAQASDFVRMPNFTNKVMSWLFFMPIDETKWSFAVFYPENAHMQPVYDTLVSSLTRLLIGMFIVLGIILYISIRFTYPINQMTLAVRKLGQGDLDAQVENVTNEDEIGELANGFNKMVGELKGHVDALAKETAARQAVQSELEVARNIQMGLIPQKYPAFANHDQFEIYGAFHPAKECAGDFYDYFFIDDDNMLIVMADVSGKGVPAALFMAVTRTVLRNIPIQNTQISPSALLKTANDIICQENENMMFVTLFLGKYNIKTGKLTYANAGHPPPLKIDNGHNISELGDSTGPMLGVFDFATWTENHITLNVHEKLFFFTDGFIEAQSPDKVMLETTGLIEALKQHKDNKLKVYCDNMVDYIKAYEADHQTDDITAMMIQRLT